MTAKETAHYLLKKIDRTGQIRNLQGVKECAYILCEELALRLPSINETPTNNRLSDDNYSEFWKRKVPGEIQNL